MRGAGELLVACRRCYASLFTDRAIAYRQEKRFDHLQVALSIGVQEAVQRMIATLIETAHACRTPVGICSQAPSTYPELAELLVARGIDSISLNPDAFVATARHVAAAERRLDDDRRSARS